MPRLAFTSSPSLRPPLPVPQRARVHCTAARAPAPDDASMKQKNRLIMEKDADVSVVLHQMNLVLDQMFQKDAQMFQKDGQIKALLDQMVQKDAQMVQKDAQIKALYDDLMKQKEIKERLSRSLVFEREEKLLLQFQMQVRGIVHLFMKEACHSLAAVGVAHKGPYPMRQIVEHLSTFRQCLEECSGLQKDDELVHLLQNLMGFVNTLHHVVIKKEGKYLIPKEKMGNDTFARVIACMGKEIELDVEVISIAEIVHDTLEDAAQS